MLLGSFVFDILQLFLSDVFQYQSYFYTRLVYHLLEKFHLFHPDVSTHHRFDVS